MKLFDIILLSLAVVFVIIGIYETMRLGIRYSYSPIMISVILFFYYSYRKRNRA